MIVLIISLLLLDLPCNSIIYYFNSKQLDGETTN